MEFISATSRQFLLTVRAPTSEKSPMLYFPAIGATQVFMPSVNGCGHGKWALSVLQRVGHRYRLIRTESLNLDGIGTLAFLIGDDLRPTIVSRLWLRIPSKGCGTNIKS
uniref:Uncharacterized protein n=1 Tax=Plectus sambesii TaxID=2011161 RepID=A0A914WNE8_9BILA